MSLPFNHLPYSEPRFSLNPLAMSEDYESVAMSIGSRENSLGLRLTLLTSSMLCTYEDTTIGCMRRIIVCKNLDQKNVVIQILTLKNFEARRPLCRRAELLGTKITGSFSPFSQFCLHLSFFLVFCRGFSSPYL